MDSRMKNVETFLCEEYDDQSESTTNENVNVAHVSKRDEENRFSAPYQPKDSYSRQDSLPNENGYDPKRISPLQSIGRYQNSRHSFQRMEDDADASRDFRQEDPRHAVGDGIAGGVSAPRDFRQEDPRHAGGDGIAGGVSASRSYIDNLKRKMGSRADNSSQQTKRGKY